MNEFTHYNPRHSEHGPKDMENCGACVLLYSGEEGPNYAGWPLSFLQNGRSIPKKYFKALLRELDRTDNDAYVNNLKNHLKAYGLSITAIENGARETL